jgi:hypothetical protein
MYSLAGFDLTTHSYSLLGGRANTILNIFILLILLKEDESGSAEEKFKRNK